MQLELIKATIEQKPILANLLELYAYDFTEFFDFDIGDDGFYGYQYLSLYWTESNRFPYLIYVNKKIAGFVLVQQGSPISSDLTIWDIAEFFIIKRYRKQRIGTSVVSKILQQFKGQWQVRVLIANLIACQFWLQAINKFVGKPPDKSVKDIKEQKWIIYSFKSD